MNKNKKMNEQLEPKIINMPIGKETDEQQISLAELEKSRDRAKDAFETKAKDLRTKKYIVSGGKDVAEALLLFIEHDAPWNAQEALGVVTLHEMLKDSLKEKEPMLEGDAIEALGYFVGKVSGTGFHTAKNFKEGNVFEPITKMLTKVMQDKKELEALQGQWQELAGRHYQMEQEEQKKVPTPEDAK